MPSLTHSHAASTLTHADHSIASSSQAMNSHLGTDYGVHSFTAPAAHGAAGTLTHSFTQPNASRHQRARHGALAAELLRAGLHPEDAMSESTGRALVACPTYAGKEYALEPWLAAFRALTYEAKHAYQVDNTRVSTRTTSS
jgi:hypothetical protein